MRLEHSIHITAPIARVWDLTLDVESWPNHTPTMTHVDLLNPGPVTVGSQARIKQPGQPERTWTITELDPERRFAWSTRAMGTTMTGIHELSPDTEGTRNTLAIKIAGPLAWLIGPIVRRSIGKAIATENAGFKRAAEA